MAREYRLVLYLGTWQVCSKARRVDEDGQPYVVWIYGPGRHEYCRVGQESDIMVIPSDPSELKKNFFGDRFLHALDIQAPHMDRRERVGAINDAGAARAAFEHLVRVTAPDTVVTLREGGRIMDEANGRAVWQPLIERWMPASE